MPFALAQALILSDAVAPDALGQALLLSATRGVALVCSLQALGTLDPQRLEQHLEKGEAPVLRHVAPILELVERLPPGLCERLLVVPVRQDARTGTVDVAVVDARDPHGAEEVAFWLGAPVRTVRTSPAAMEAALRRLDEGPASLGMQALAPPIDSVPPPPLEPQAPGPNIPIPLTRRNPTSTEILAEEIQADPVAPSPPPPRPRAPTRPPPPPPFREPVLDLSRRKGSAFPRPTSVAPATERQYAVPPPPRPQVAVPAPSKAPAVPLPVSRPPAPPLPPRSPSGSASAIADTAPTAVPDSEPTDVMNEAAHGPAEPEPATPLRPQPLPVDAIAHLRTAADRDRIIELIVTGTRSIANKVAVLAVRRDTLVGWACSPELGEQAAFRKVSFSTETPTILTEVIDQGGAWLARFPEDPAHTPLLHVLKVT
ncbi:MAG: hypothetical protein ACRENE_23880, partial [Polyangiaceae bacterium]